MSISICYCYCVVWYPLQLKLLFLWVASFQCYYSQEPQFDSSTVCDVMALLHSGQGLKLSGYNAQQIFQT